MSASHDIPQPRDPDLRELDGTDGHKAATDTQTVLVQGTLVHTRLLTQDDPGPPSAAILQVRSRHSGNLKKPFRVHEVKTNFLAVRSSYLPSSLSFAHERTVEFFRRPHDMGYCTDGTPKRMAEAGHPPGRRVKVSNNASFSLVVFVLENIVIF